VGLPAISTSFFPFEHIPSSSFLDINSMGFPKSRGSISTSCFYNSVVSNPKLRVIVFTGHAQNVEDLFEWVKVQFTNSEIDVHAYALPGRYIRSSEAPKTYTEILHELCEVNCSMYFCWFFHSSPPLSLSGPH